MKKLKDIRHETLDLRNLFILISICLTSHICFAQTLKINDAKKGVSYTCTDVTFSEFSYSMKEKIDKVKFSYEIDKPEIPYGNEFKFTLSRPRGFKEKDGKVQLDIYLKVIDKEGKVVLDAPDIYATDNAAGGTDTSEVKSGISLFVATGDPLKINAEYTLEFGVKDKWGSGSIEGTFKFWTTKHAAVEYEAKGLSCSGPIFITMPEKNTITDAQKTPAALSSIAKKLYCVFAGLTVWKLENGKALADASLKLTGPDGKVILESSDLFKEYNDAGGIDPKEIESIPVSLTIGDPMEYGKTYKAEFMVVDKRTKGFAKASLVFTLTKP
ncbi:MAG TPA: hypothetical protein VF411_01005 [Bacteroidia bacterium]